jgi:flavodoxin
MKAVIVYWSRYGNGKIIVHQLGKKIEEKGDKVQIFKTDEVDPTAMPQADLYIFSAPTEAFNIQRNMRTFIKKLEAMEGKKYGIINTHAMKKNWLTKMEKMLSKKKMIKAASVDFRVGKEANTGQGLTEGWEKKLNVFAKELLHP